MRYIVSGYIGFDNFGDEAIASSLVQKLKQSGAERITLISSNPAKTAELYGVDSCQMIKYIPSLIKSDVLISGGGSLLQDVTSLKSLIYYLTVIFSALFLRKKVEIFSQGIGPIKSKIGQIFTRIALKHVNKITVRDKSSQELLKSWGIDSELVQDPVLTLDLPHKNQMGTIGIQLRKFTGVNKEFLNKLSAEIKNKFGDKKVELLSLQDSVDLDVCQDFEKMLKNLGFENVEVLFGLNVNEIIERISNLEYLVAMRYHANVIGIKAGVKTIAINYDPKVKALADEYNLPIIELDCSNFSKEFDKVLNKN